MFKNNKPAISDQSTTRINHAPGSRSNNGLSGFAIYEDTRSRAGLCAKFDVNPATGRPGPPGARLVGDLGQRL
jgi:hypothetical protein